MIAECGPFRLRIADCGLRTLPIADCGLRNADPSDCGLRIFLICILSFVFHFLQSAIRIPQSEGSDQRGSL